MSEITAQLLPSSRRSASLKVSVGRRGATTRSPTRAPEAVSGSRRGTAPSGKVPRSAATRAAGPERRAGDGRRRRADRAVALLPRGVGAPAPPRLVGAQGARVLRRGRERADAREREGGRGEPLRLGVAAVAELAQAVVTPT